MEEFKSMMVQIASGQAAMLEPVPFAGRVTEAQLEEWLLANPRLAGESLLVLGSQLAEFAEDKDRLDVLAVDQRGEIVLLELKVDGAFRLTDLQALAYAAGYSAVQPEHYAEILRKRLGKENPHGATLDDAKQMIAAFVDVLDEFDDWQPSKRVRIKLVAPGYPRRVLHTVKWLGDVYAMPIEAIEVQLFEDSAGHYQLTFERLLPLKSDDAFDLTIKQTEEIIAGVHKPKKPAILRALVENGIIESGQQLWFNPDALTVDAKHMFDPNNIAFRVILDTTNGRPMFRWTSAPGATEELLMPSLAWYSILDAIQPGRYSTKNHAPVYNQYSLEPEGPTLEQIALDTGVW